MENEQTLISEAVMFKVIAGVIVYTLQILQFGSLPSIILSISYFILSFLVS
jgi:hypothetical protein